MRYWIAIAIALSFLGIGVTAPPTPDDPIIGVDGDDPPSVIPEPITSESAAGGDVTTPIDSQQSEGSATTATVDGTTQASGDDDIQKKMAVVLLGHKFKDGATNKEIHEAHEHVTGRFNNAQRQHLEKAVTDHFNGHEVHVETLRKKITNAGKDKKVLHPLDKHMNQHHNAPHNGGNSPHTHPDTHHAIVAAHEPHHPKVVPGKPAKSKAPGPVNKA